ncbi:hypothetical protein QTO34_014048 [Cnephaeus nilssonii]|uniref:Uncharacterized protein n=1 Tax=Cnephaeus nilssonii TaxID=3371016 RepID=A0AA40I936_CNENI|nr:hypothetical protein QTO34_014048 [Eptesicus nilssonii]
MSAERHLMSAERRPTSSLLSPDWPRPALQLACDSEDRLQSAVLCGPRYPQTCHLRSACPGTVLQPPQR